VELTLQESLILTLNGDEVSAVTLQKVLSVNTV